MFLNAMTLVRPRFTQQKPDNTTSPGLTGLNSSWMVFILKSYEALPQHMDRQAYGQEKPHGAEQLSLDLSSITLLILSLSVLRRAAWYCCTPEMTLLTVLS